MAVTGAPTYIRRYCKPIASDTTNWPDATLNTLWDTAHERLKQFLCPPFAEAAIEAFNADATDTDSGNDLIARMAALLVYEAIPGQSGKAYDNLYRDLFGGTTEPGDKIVGLIEKLQTGEASLFDVNGSRLSRVSGVYHTLEDTPYRVFSRTLRTSDGTLSGSTGSLDQFDKL